MNFLELTIEGKKIIVALNNVASISEQVIDKGKTDITFLGDKGRNFITVDQNYKTIEKMILFMSDTKYQSYE